MTQRVREFFRDGWDYWTETPEREWLFFRIQAAVAIVNIAVAAVLISWGF